MFAAASRTIGCHGKPNCKYSRTTTALDRQFRQPERAVPADPRQAGACLSYDFQDLQVCLQEDGQRPHGGEIIQVEFNPLPAQCRALCRLIEMYDDAGRINHRFAFFGAEHRGIEFG